MNTIKKDFPLLENENITYLDSGATTQKPIQVIKAVEEFYQKYNANPHRGAYSLSVEATEQYENTRTKIAKFINARHREEIIFSKNATESLNLIAYSYGMDNLKKDDEVVISIMEHHSNLVPWQKVTKKTGSKLNYMYINDEFELTDEEIENACRKAAIHDFIMTLPEGYDTPVGELGDTLSGGEKQRIGLARVFLHNSDLVLLDEPTSNLDSLNEAVILKSLAKERLDKTVVLVSHRQSTMRIADRIYSVENGRMS